jgi:cell division protein FtsI (penicillin-binding protein 3)
MVVVVFTVLAARIADIQTRDRASLAALGRDQRVKHVTLAAERGGIFDRNGHELALSLDRETIWADPRVIKHPAEVAAKLAPIVGVDEFELRSRLSQSDKAFVYVLRKAEPDVAGAVRKLGLTGVGFAPESKRYYPSGDVAGPVLGSVGLDNDGQGGLEYALERTLAGQPGELTVERDPTGNDLPGTERTVRAAQRGVDLVLTLDQSIQYETERALVDQVNAVDAKGGMAIVIDVKTGDILAMANVDGETADAPAHPAPATEQNRTVTDVFEPGSTNKVVTIAAAIEAGIVKPDTVIQTPGALMIDGTRFEDVESHPGEMTVADVLRESSNVGTITIARELGKVRFDAAVRNFGFGRVTGLDFPGEAPGIILPLANYNDTSMASMPIGNGLAVTALQMLDVYVTLANDGVARQPRIVAATIGDDGKRLDLPFGTTRRVVSPETAKMMRDMLAHRRRRGRHGREGAGARLHRGRQDRHRAQASVRSPAVPVRLLLRRVCAGRERASRRHRGDGRAGPGVLREHCGGTGVLAHHAARARRRAGDGIADDGR